MVGGIGGIGCNQGQMMQLMADADWNGSVTKDEMTHALGGAGKDVSRVDRIFERVDTDGNGAIIQAEHDAAVEARMNPMQPPGPRGGTKPPGTETDHLATLLENQTETVEDEEIRTQMQEFLTQLESGAFNNQEIFRQNMSLKTSYSPTVDVKA